MRGVRSAVAVVVIHEVNAVVLRGQDSMGEQTVNAVVLRGQDSMGEQTVAAAALLMGCTKPVRGAHRD
eukprot:COSAG03_NODE_8935_length_758_cov_3.417299_2_plen_68_part_00